MNLSLPSLLTSIVNSSPLEYPDPGLLGTIASTAPELFTFSVKTAPTPKITDMPQVIYDRFTDLLKQKNDVSMGLVSRKLSLHR